MADQDSRQVPISEAMRMAIDHHQAGRLREAEIVYRAVLQSEPEHAGASYNLGLIALQSGRPREAVPVLRAALQADPNNAAYWMNYAVSLAGSGAPEAAQKVLVEARSRGFRGEALERLLAQVQRMMQSGAVAAVVETVVDGGVVGQRSPNLAALLALHGAGQYGQAEAQARALLAEFPASAAVARVLGSSLLAQEKFESARQALAQAGESIPGDAQIQYLLGLALRRLRRNEEARAAFERSLALAPDDVEVLLNASANAVTLGDAAEARRYGEQALALQPDDINALRVLADAAMMEGSNEEAVELYGRGIGIDPKAADLYVNLGDALTNLGRPDEAVAEIEQALALQPGHPQAHSSVGRALYQLGETAAACGHYRTASELAPDMPEAHTAYLFCLLHDDNVPPEEIFREHQRLGALIEAPMGDLRQSHANDRDPERGLRVGFVSADLREHAVAYLLEPIWRAMRGGRHQVIAYANMRGEDAVSDRLRTLTDAWVRVERMDDATLAERIRADRIDVLFDLSGHTVGNRLPVFARKPAPIQASWLGYPGTTGMSTMDYRFVRSLQDELGEMQKYFTEKLIRYRYRGFAPEAGAPPVNASPALVNGRVTFGSFGRPAKISNGTVALWGRVLHAVPDSMLLIAAVGNARTRDRLLSLFESQGIAADRLTFRAHLSLRDYLALHHEVDIALDTFPYSGGTTTNHALWMGVPVLTLAGTTLQQNLSSLILGTIGLPDWIAHGGDAFVERARTAGADFAELNRLRQDLRPRMAAASEGAAGQIGREMDTALRVMWRRWCAGLGPESFTVS